MDNKNSALIAVYFGSLILFIFTFFLVRLDEGKTIDSYQAFYMVLLIASGIIHLFCLVKLAIFYFKKN